jgi:glycosyltransferase involved in cell wall biosynthesis
VTDRCDAKLSFDELVVHAIAQLPVSLSVDDLRIDPEPPALLAAEAYGVLERIPRAPADAARATVRRAGSLASLVDDLRGVATESASTSGPIAGLAGERVLVLSKAATHYRIPLFEEIGRRLRSVGAGFKAVFLTEASGERWWMERGALDFEHAYLEPRRWSRTSGGAIMIRGFDEHMRGYAPTLVLSGGFSPGVSGRAARCAARMKIPFGIWSGEIPSRRTARNRARWLQRRRLIADASFAVAYGSQSAAYLRALSPELPIVIGRNTTILPDCAETFRKGRRPRLLAVSRAVEGKRLDIVIDAVRLIPQDVELLVIGDGPDLEGLRRRATGDARIRFAGALPSGDVRKAFGEADAFLFPSEFDSFGLVLVEAMAAGLTCIVSPAPGAVDDLCVPDRNAVIVGGSEPARWADAITRVLASPDRSAALGAAAAATIRHRWTLEHAADAMIAGFRLGQLTRGARSVTA